MKNVIKNNKPVIDVWALSEEEFANIPIGTWVYAGEPSNKGVWCGVKKDSGIKVVAWYGGYSKKPDCEFEEHVTDLMKYAGSWVEPAPEPEISAKKSRQIDCYETIELAAKDAKESWKVIRGRHELIGLDVNGDRVDSTQEFVTKAKLSQKFIQSYIDLVSQNESVVEICFQAGFDGADSVLEMSSEDYNPWVSCESVTLWERS